MALPEALVEQYWDTVAQLLKDQHGLKDREARAEVAEYRAVMLPLTGETTYNCCDPPEMATRLARFHERGGTRRVFAPYLHTQKNGKVKD